MTAHRASTRATNCFTLTTGRAVALALLVPLVAASLANAQPFAYVVGQPDASGPAVVSVIDTATNLRVAAIPARASCRLCVMTDGITIAPDIGRLYVTNDFDQSVSVIDIASNTVVATLAVGTGPTAIASSPNGARVYVLNGGGATAVSEIDTATNTILRTTPLAVLQARGMAITPDGRRLYVSTFSSNSVKVVDTETMSVIATINAVGSLPLGVDVSPDGAHVYVATYSSNAVSVISTATNTVVAAIPVGVNPLSARVTPDGSRVYVANHGANTVSVIDRQTHSVVATVAVGFNPRTFDFTPDSARAYLANSTTVEAINTANNTVIGTIQFDIATHGYPASIVMGRAPLGNPPTAVSDSYGTAINTTLNNPAPGVLANDHNGGGGPTTAVLVSGVSNGALTLNADGSFAYTPAVGFAGTDGFTYRAVNDAGNSNLATVVLQVVTGPQPPTGLYISSIVGNTVTLRWTPPAVGDTPTGYVLKGGILPGEVLAAIPSTSSAPVFTFVAPSGSFYIRMHTVSGANESAPSEEIRLVVSTSAVPSSPANLLGMVNGSNVSLSWRNTFEGGTPSALLLQVSGSLSTTLLLPVADSVSVTGVPDGTYTLALRAVNPTGPGEVSNPITLTFPGPCSGVPQAPANFVAAKDGSLITVLWERATSGPAATSFLVNVSGSFVGSLPTGQRSLSGTVGPGSYTISIQALNACGSSVPTLPQTVNIP